MDCFLYFGSTEKEQNSVNGVKEVAKKDFIHNRHKIPRSKRMTFADLSTNKGGIVKYLFQQYGEEKSPHFCLMESDDGNNRLYQKIVETSAVETFGRSSKQCRILPQHIEDEHVVYVKFANMDLFGASSEPQEKKKQKQEESMYLDDHITTFDSHNVDTNNYSFSDSTSSASK
ncbi:Uncharacterized protein Fot_10054 [Forsythia ovata]|uniref:Uncharacterized protein n=1 Tax=Forsythia ovata TaxID=205694 RepID=A0ABD1WFQ8_9LAMI